MNAEITVSRGQQGYPDRIRAYRLVVDGRVVESVKRGESVTIPAQPGHHRIWMRIDWCRSPIIDLELRDDERVVLTCRPGARLFLLPLYLTVWRGRYVKLELEKQEPLALNRS